MEYLSFIKDLPVLHGQITVNGKCKIGHFKAEWDSKTNSMTYKYYTHNGRKGTGGFSLQRAYSLFKNGIISTNPENGNPENYI
jgi:hypothetical protein